MNLPADVARCAGRFGLGERDPVCARRAECARHAQMAADRERWPQGYPPYVSVQTGLCRDGGDFFLPASGGAA